MYATNNFVKQMNIKEQLLLEKSYSKEMALLVSEYACASKNNFEELVKCFLNNDYRIAQRAAWSLAWAARKKPEMITPYLETLVNQLGRKDVHSAVIRNSVRILEAVEIPEHLHGAVMKNCFEYIENHETPIAIKAFSLTTLFNLSKIYKDIQPELKMIIETLYPNESAAFKGRAKLILKKLGAPE
jgi:hypothetical protein